MIFLDENYKHFGYGYIEDVTELIPNVPILYYSFRLMVGLGLFFILLFAWPLWAMRKEKRELQETTLVPPGSHPIHPLAYIASQRGWIVAEMGRQPWAVQDALSSQG